MGAICVRINRIAPMGRSYGGRRGENCIQFIMRLVVGLQHGAGGLQGFRHDAEHDGPAIRQPHGVVGEDAPRLDVIHVFRGPMEFGVFASRFDVTRPAPAIAALDDKIAVLVMASEELIKPVEDFGPVAVYARRAGFLCNAASAVVFNHWQMVQAQRATDALLSWFVVGECPASVP